MVIDAAAPGARVEKAMADVDRDGDLDVVSSPHGWYGDDHPLVVYLNAQG